MLMGTLNCLSKSLSTQEFKQLPSDPEPNGWFFIFYFSKDVRQSLFAVFGVSLKFISSAFLRLSVEIDKTGGKRLNHTNISWVLLLESRERNFSFLSFLFLFHFFIFIFVCLGGWVGQGGRGINNRFLVMFARAILIKILHNWFWTVAKEFCS